MSGALLILNTSHSQEVAADSKQTDIPTKLLSYKAVTTLLWVQEGQETKACVTSTN